MFMTDIEFPKEKPIKELVLEDIKMATTFTDSKTEHIFLGVNMLATIKFSVIFDEIFNVKEGIV